jgi:hypothetical protein
MKMLHAVVIHAALRDPIKCRGIFPENALLEVVAKIFPCPQLRNGVREITVAMRIIGSEYDPFRS